MRLHYTIHMLESNFALDVRLRNACYDLNNPRPCRKNIPECNVEYQLSASERI